MKETTDSLTTAIMLRAEHARLERLYERLLDAYRAGEWTEVCRAWNHFEPALRAHMSLEEKHVFPSFRAIDAKEVDDLLAEHRLLRQQLDVLGINVELHAVPQLDANDLIERLRAHRTREERLLYPWLDATGATPHAFGAEP